MSRDPNAYFNFTLPTGGAPVVILHPRQARGAVASLILGIAGLLLVAAFIGFPLAIAGIVCGINGLIAVHKGGGRIRGRGLAIAGLALSVIALAGGGFYVATKKESAPAPLRIQSRPPQHDRLTPLPPKDAPRSTVPQSRSGAEQAPF